MEWSGVRKIKAKQVTLAASFAAVYFVTRATPTFQMIGVFGGFTAGDFFLTSIAIIAGTWTGIVAVFVATVAAYAVRPPVFFGLDFLPGLVNVLVVGLILSKRLRIARIFCVVILVLFLISPYSLLFGYSYVPYAWLHIIALAIVLSPIAGKVSAWITRNDSHMVWAIGVLAFVGTMLQHLVGGLLFEMTAGVVGVVNPAQFREVWRIIFWLYPPERIVIITFSTIIATALVRSLRKWSIFSQLK